MEQGAARLPRQLRKYLGGKTSGERSLPQPIKPREHIEHLEASSAALVIRPPRPSRCRAASRSWTRSCDRDPGREEAIHFSLPSRRLPAGRWWRSRHLAKNDGPKQVLEDVSFTIDRGDRIALVGANGAGKSTLIRMLSGLNRHRAALRLGHNVTAEYFAQDQYKVLEGDARMLDDISNTAPVYRPQSCAVCWAASFSPATMSLNRWVCSQEESATAMPWRASW